MDGRNAMEHLPQNGNPGCNPANPLPGQLVRQNLQQANKPLELGRRHQLQPMLPNGNAGGNRAHLEPGQQSGQNLQLPRR
jgi:hypothetical protein